jgi:two-component sensor histidine kinase
VDLWRTISSGRVWRGELKNRAKDGTIYWVDTTIVPFLDDEGKPRHYVAIRADITERKKAEENIRLLMGEVNHRSKNLLSVVQSIAVLSSKLADPQTFASDLMQRIAGLSACQDLLLQSEWNGVDVADLVRAQLAPFRDLVDRRIFISGPKAGLNPAAAQAIGMALHELSTNAAKYGALSNLDGRVLIGWSVTAEGNASKFCLHWLEEGGPKVEPPTRKGFGQKVMVSMVEAAVNGKVQVEYCEAGIAWRLTAPVAATLENAAPPMADSAKTL